MMEDQCNEKIDDEFDIFLFDGALWDDFEEIQINYIKEAGISKSEKMCRINEINSVWRKFDGRGNVFSQDQIENQIKEEGGSLPLTPKPKQTYGL